MKPGKKGMPLIGIIANSKKATAARLLPRLHVWLKKRGLKAIDSVQVSRAEIFHRASLIICLGGDGTLLSVASQMKGRSIPILGVNLGELGFLTEVKQSEVFEELDYYLKGKSKLEKRLMLSCQATSTRWKRGHHFTALNDIVISREGLSRLVYVEVYVNEHKLTSFSGDGVIIATPTGSTAYSLSAGGSILHPKLHTIMITPICPHASALRSLVVSADEEITVRMQAKGDASKALLTADGQENLEIDDSYTIRVTRAKSVLTLVKSSKRNYFQTLREIFRFPV